MQDTRQYTWEEFSDGEKLMCKVLCEEDLLFFCRAFYRFSEGSKFLVNFHHHLICDELEAIESGEIQNLVINMPPGGSKTHIGSICFPARGMSKEIKARFLEASYSDELVQHNSSQVRDLVLSEEFQTMWPTKIASDSSSKKHWNLIDHRGKRSGAFKAASTGGPITGFRAGKLQQDKYYGTLILDDPNKPTDMLSDKRRKNSNEVINNTVKSRRGSHKTPIVIIQQRLHPEDATGFVLKGKRCIKDAGWYKIWETPNNPGAPTWKQIILPALIDDAYVALLPEKYAKYVNMFGERDDKGRYSYWAEKEALGDLLEMEATSPYVFAAQYQQKPMKLGGTIFKEEWWQYYNRANTPRFEWRFIIGDTAQKINEWNDFSVFSCWGVSEGKIYLIDRIRGKWEAHVLRAQFIAFVSKHNNADAYDKERYGKIRAAYVEDKVSGTGLIQEVRHALPVPVLPKKVSVDKFQRAGDATPSIESGRVVLPEDADWIVEWVSEHTAFTIDDSHDNDDCVDNTMHATDIGIRGEMLTSQSGSVGVGGSTGGSDWE